MKNLQFQSTPLREERPLTRRCILPSGEQRPVCYRIRFLREPGNSF